MAKAMLGASDNDVLFAQQFDRPTDDPDPNESIDRLNTDGLTLEQQFSSYHYLDVGFNDVIDEHGVKVFSAAELKNLIGKEIPLSYVERFQKLRDASGKPLFDARDIVKFYENDIGKKSLSKSLKKIGDKNLSRQTLIKALYKRGYKDWRVYYDELNYIFCNAENYRTLYSLSLVKRSYGFFKDTPKPNLLMIYPAIDEEKAFFSASAREMIKKLAASYDVWFATVYDEKDFYKAIRKAPKIDLLILSGHGTSNNIQLSIPVEGYEDLSYIDSEDKELKRHLKHLKKDATIFLNSCSTGKGKDKKDNLANTIAALAPGRQVISATKPFSIGEIRIRNNFPLILDIPGKVYVTQNYTAAK